MKKLQIMLYLVLACIILMTAGQTVWADSKPRDVPSNNPAYQAVKMLLDEGYLQLYQDQTFQGDKPVDRFTLANLVARILDEISSGKIGTSKSDIEVLRNLTAEFHDELLQLNAKGEIFNQKLDDLSRQNQVLREDLTSATASVQGLTADQALLQKEAQNMIADIQGLKGKVAALTDQNSQLKTDLDQAVTKLGQANADLNQAQADFNLARKDVDQTKADLAKTQADLAQTNAALEQSKNENSILRIKQQSQQTYLWVAIILAVIGIVH